LLRDIKIGKVFGFSTSNILDSKPKIVEELPFICSMESPSSNAKEEGSFSSLHRSPKAENKNPSFIGISSVKAKICVSSFNL